MNSSTASDWRYTAEGGANLVLSYVGTDPSLSGKLLRLRKRKKPTNDDKHQGPIGEDVNLRFSTEVIAPLLGEEFVVQMDKVQVRREFLEALREELERTGVRPEERKCVDEVDVGGKEVVLAEDLIHGNGVLAVEIKPKWGFLPSPTYLSSSTLPLKTTYCRFCMHSSLKSQKRYKFGACPLEDATECYCPLNLYSKEPERVKLAIEQLWSKWVETGGEANNLRLFLDGERVAPDNLADLERLSHMLKSSSDPVSLLNAFSSLLQPALLSSHLLSNLRHLQSSLDFLDIEGLSSILQFRGTSLEQVASAPQPTIDEWISWRSRWTSAVSQKRAEELETRDLVLAYLLSATFKDCSIFVQFKRDKKGEWAWKLKAIDLDPKPLKKLVRYKEMDEEIVKAFEEEVGRKKGKVRRCRV